MKRVKKSLIFWAVMCLLAGCQKKMTVQDYLDLGDKYLTEANYEEAIVEFTKAIEVEPKAMKAYEGLANAYIKTENYEKAQETLQSGISVYEGLTEDEKTDEFKLIYEELLKLEEKIRQYLDAENSSNVEENENETLAETDPTDAEQERLIAEVKEKYGSILEQVVAEINSQEPTLTHYFTDDFRNFVKELEKPLIWQQEDGNYLGLYVGTDGDVYMYLGEMDNGIRAGYGSWYGEYDDEEYSAIGTQLFYGNWSEDYPHGSGTMLVISYDSEHGKDQDKIQGNYQEGYENGTMNEIEFFNEPDGSYVNITDSYVADHGIPHILYVDEDGCNVVSEDDDCTLIYHNGDYWGIDGAMKP